MKKLICLLLAAVMLISLAACGGETNNGETGETGENQALQEAFEATVPAHPEAPAEGATDEEILNYRRELVAQQMMYHNSVLWTPDVDIAYSLDWNTMGVEQDIANGSENVIQLKAGRIYRGLPYTHGNNSVHAFIDFFSSVDEKGVFTMSGVGEKHFSGVADLKPIGCARLGTDCADAVFWAWAHVSNSITFKETKNMTRINGCLPVGDYVCNDAQYARATTEILEENGRDKMMECYALLQKADGLVFVNRYIQGHAVMCMGVNVVRDDNGKIDSSKSYATILEQQSGGERVQEAIIDEATGLEIYPLDGINVEWSFDKLYSTGYLPVTCQELIDPSPLPEPAVIDPLENVNSKNMFSGTISATRPIASVTLSVYDSNNTKIQEATAYVTAADLPEFGMMRFSSDIEKGVMHGSYDLKSLAAGEYKCVFTATLGDGSEIEFRNVPYVVE